MFKHTIFKRGEKQLKVLQYIDSNPQGVRYTDIIKLAYELSHGKDTYDYRMNRGYWSFAFSDYYARPGWATILLDHRNSRYFINEDGIDKMAELNYKLEYKI